MEVKLFTLDEAHRDDLGFLLAELSGKSRHLSLGSHSNVFCVGAFDGVRLIGFVQLFILPKTTFTTSHIEDLVVHPDYRRQGIGKRLLEGVILVAKENKADVISLTTRPERGGAVKLFEAVGFASPDNMTLRLVLK